MRKLLILFVSALLPWLSVRSQKPVYKDAGQPVETRVKDLLNRMTGASTESIYIWGE